MSTPRSRKNKGQRLQKVIVEMLRETYSLDAEEKDCFNGDLQARPMGMSGLDVVMSPRAKQLIPFDIEAKNQESLSIWKAIEQVNNNSDKDRVPIVVFKRNRSDIYAAIKFDDLLKLKEKL